MNVIQSVFNQMSATYFSNKQCLLGGAVEEVCGTEAQWHIGMSSASQREDPGSNPGKG